MGTDSTRRGGGRPRKGGRAKTGTPVKLKDGRWQAIITLADGGRKRLPPFPPGTSEALARENAACFAERAASKGLKRKAPTPAAAPGSNERWFEVWTAEREARGFTSVRENVSHYRTHILPSIGDKTIAEWSTDDLRKLSRDLTSKVQNGALSAKTAINIWGTASKMCDDAVQSNNDALRIRDDSPAQTCAGPNAAQTASSSSSTRARSCSSRRASKCRCHDAGW